MKKEPWLLNRKNILAAIVFCTTSLPIGIWTAYTHFEEKAEKERTETRAFIESISAIDKVYDALRSVVYHTDAHRGLLLRAEDSGDIPVPGKDIYSSIVYEVFDQYTEPYKSSWRRQLIDGQYTSLLTQIAKRGYVKLIVSEIEPSILKDVLVSQDTAQAHFYKIHAEPAYFFYASFAYRKSEALLPGEYDRMRAQASAIRLIFLKNRSHLEAFKL